MSAAPESDASFKALQYRFAAHLRDPVANPAPEGIEDRRLQIYRELFFNNVETLIGTGFPVIKRILGRKAWLQLMRRFYAEHQSHTPLFPEIGREFQRYLQARAERGEDDLPFLVELAHYEWVELALSLDEQEISDIAHDPDGDLLECAPVVSPLAWLLQYRYPVHLVREDFLPHEPTAVPSFLVVSRNRNDDIVFTELTALTFALLELLKANPGVSGLDAIEALIGALGITDAGATKDAAIAMLHRFRERDIILGTS